MIGELTTHYDEKARTAAVNRLLSYVEREHELLYTNPHTDSPVFQSIGQTTRRRHELIKSMIHEFCRTLVGVEFNYYRPDDSNVVQPQSDQSPKGDPETSPGTKFRPFGKKK